MDVAELMPRHPSELWLSQSRSAPDFARVEWTRRSRVAASIRL